MKHPFVPPDHVSVAADQAAVPGATAPAAARPHRRGLFRKYLLLILSLVSGALLASGAISLYFSYQENTSAIASLQHEKAIAAASRIEQYIRTIEQQLKFAALPQLDATDVELRRIEFLKLLRQVPEVTDIAQLDASGREQLAVSRLGMDDLGSGKDRAQEPAFRNARRGQSWFSPVYFRKETEPYMTIAIRSGSDTGPVTIAEVNLKFIWDVVSRIKIGDKGKAYVVDRTGFLVADPDIGLVLRKTNLSDLKHVSAATGLQTPDQPAMLSQDLAGTQVLASFAPIDLLNWKVFVEQPVAEVYAKLNASIVRTAFLLLAGLVISALGALALARGMVRPIRTLSEGARRIGEGDLAQQIDVRTGDELETLADRFNRMTGQLRESYAGLERKVDERTHELTNSLEQQTAISEILRVISSSPTDVQPVLDAVAERAARLCNAPFARILLIDGDVLRPTAEFSLEDIALALPVPFDRTSLTGRAAKDGKTVHVADVIPLLDTEFPGAQGNMERSGGRAVLAVPLMREGGAYGAIFLYRREPGLFAPDQVALVETFARQAAIAIDNVRLFNETREALDQQRASGDVLSAISSSISDTQPVFDTILQSCERLFAGTHVGVILVRDGMLDAAALRGPGWDEWKQQYPRPVSRDTASGIAILEHRVVDFPDVDAADFPPLARDASGFLGYRSIAAAPLIVEGRGIGALWVGRPVKGAFGDKQLAMLKTFADQAVIAIENVRLFNETKEALDQQTAISEILRVISSSPTDVQPVLDAIAERAARLCDAAAASIYLTDGDMLRHLASKGPSPDPVTSVDALPISRESTSGRALLERTTIHVRDMLAEVEEYPLSAEIARRSGHRTIVVMPLLREGQPFGTILLRRQEVRPFTDHEIGLLRTFGDQAAIALENVRLFNETKEALERQTAISEILRVISSSPTDVRPVLKAVAERAARICEADDSRILLAEGGNLQVTMGDQYLKGPAEGFSHPIERGWVAGRAFIDRKPVHVIDLQSDDAVREFPAGARIAREFGVRTTLAVPLLREDASLGVILLRRSSVKAFDGKQIALLETFAAQAAIAIENVRLFNETKEALEQQQASGEVLAAISSSIADTAPVFERILQSCERLFAGKLVQINLVGDDGLVYLGPYHGPGREQLDRMYPFAVDATSVTGVAILSRSVVHFPDAERATHLPERARKAWGSMTIKAAIGAPMLWEGKGIGSIIVGRDYAGAFSDKDIALLRTFADQAVIAIQNARLFREIQDKSRELEIANKHKSEFLANMSHELRTPLNAIIGFSEVLLERLFGELNVKQDDYLKDIHASGRHLLALINDILELSKIEAGRFELELATFDLPTALGDAMTLIRQRAHQHNIQLGLDTDPALQEVNADERKVKQILVNLLSNAVKFTPDGGRIDVSARRGANEVVIAIRDTGIGIDAKDHETIFEEFRQAGGHYSNKREGTGLGLSLARRFVELHGGRIWLESAAGQGSTFSFTLPDHK